MIPLQKYVEGHSQKQVREDHREKEQNKNLKTNQSLIFKSPFLVKGFCVF